MGVSASLSLSLSRSSSDGRVKQGLSLFTLAAIAYWHTAAVERPRRHGEAMRRVFRVCRLDSVTELAVPLLETAIASLTVGGCGAS